tara:strand:- start:61 stop:666 length:606 start_codon:yes stop_codon:yes gene_type:complete
MKVQSIQHWETYNWILYKHYAKRLPSIIFSFGLFIDNELTGVITYGMPASSFLCKGICGVKYRNNVLELNRLCLKNNEKNEASYLIAHSLKLLPTPKIVVSYADTAQNHVGYIYQATNFIYTGLTVKRTDPFVGDKHPRHATDPSIRQERSRKHRYVYFCGDKQQKLELLNSLNYPIEPYPKGKTQRYDSGDCVPTQLKMF